MHCCSSSEWMNSFFIFMSQCLELSSDCPSWSLMHSSPPSYPSSLRQTANVNNADLTWPSGVVQMHNRVNNIVPAPSQTMVSLGLHDWPYVDRWTVCAVLTRYQRPLPFPPVEFRTKGALSSTLYHRYSVINAFLFKSHHGWTRGVIWMAVENSAHHSLSPVVSCSMSVCYNVCPEPLGKRLFWRHIFISSDSGWSVVGSHPPSPRLDVSWERVPLVAVLYVE